MKIRNGFVSNSSSSSFILLGVPFAGNYDEIEDGQFPEGIRSLYVETSSYDYLVGYILADDEEISDGSVELTKLKKMSQDVADALKVDINEIKLYFGTRYC